MELNRTIFGVTAIQDYGHRRKLLLQALIASENPTILDLESEYKLLHLGNEEQQDYS